MRVAVLVVCALPCHCSKEGRLDFELRAQTLALAAWPLAHGALRKHVGAVLLEQLHNVVVAYCWWGRGWLVVMVLVSSSWSLL